MWIISQHGFYSIVRDRDNATRFLVRGRVRSDLENLKKLAGFEGSVLKTPEADYHYRIIVDEKEVPRIMNCLANTIDYPNFKGRIANRKDQVERLGLYHEVWGTLQRLQK